MNTVKIYLAILCLVAPLAGCSGLLTSKQKVDQFYTLNALNASPLVAIDVPATISIESPEVSKGLNSNQIMLMRSPQRLDYYARARWSTSLGHMVQSSLVESFENSGSLARVGSDHSSMRADYLLILEVRDFQAEYTDIDAPPTIHIKIVAKLVTFPEREIAATFTAEVFDTATSNELTHIVAAFDEAFGGAQELIMEEALDYFTQTQ